MKREVRQLRDRIIEISAVSHRSFAGRSCLGQGHTAGSYKVLPVLPIFLLRKMILPVDHQR